MPQCLPIPYPSKSRWIKIRVSVPWIPTVAWIATKERKLTWSQKTTDVQMAISFIIVISVPLERMNGSERIGSVGRASSYTRTYRGSELGIICS